MKIFDQPENFPPVLFHVWEYLRVFGSTPENELVDWLAQPDGTSVLNDPDSEATGASKVKMPEATVRSIIRVGQFLNIFSESGNQIELSPGFSQDLNHAIFWDLVRSFVFDVGKQSNAGEQNESLPIAIAWYLSFPFSATPRDWKSASRSLAVDFNSPATGKTNKDWIISNETQWMQFVRWLISLGFARQMPVSRGTSTTLIPDVSRAVLPTTKRVVTDELIPVSTLISELAKDIPAFHGGRAWEMLPNSAKERSSLYSDTLLAGLQVLAHKNVIELVTVQDSPHTVPFGDTHVSLDRIRKAKSR
jgi:hypothetical protein